MEDLTVNKIPSAHSLLSIPHELLIEIARHLKDEEGELLSFTHPLHELMLANKQLHKIIEPLLYRDNADRVKTRVFDFEETVEDHQLWPFHDLGEPMSALTWAVVHNRQATVDRVVQVTPEIIFVKHVTLALQHGHLGIARILLNVEQVINKLREMNLRITQKVAETPEGRDTYVSSSHPIYEAVIHGDLPIVQQILGDTHANFYRRSESHQWGHGLRSPLHLACEAGKLDIIHYLLEHGADPAGQARERVRYEFWLANPTPLGLALKEKRHYVFYYLVGRFPDLLKSQFSFCSALEWGDESVCDVFFRAGVDVRPSSSYNMLAPLHSAIAGGNASLVKRLLDLGADVAPITLRYEPRALWPMDMLVQHGANENSAAIAKLLLEHGAETRLPAYGPRRLTSLDIAVKSNSVALVAFLLQHMSLEENLTSVGLARSPEMVKLLLEHGADYNKLEPPLRTFLLPEEPVRVNSVHCNRRVCQWPGDDLPGALQLLALESHALSLNDTKSCWETPLAWCCRRSLPSQDQPQLMETVKTLLSLGADPNIGNHLGEAPLWIAASHGSVELVKLLLQARADSNATDKRYGRTALHEALRSDYYSEISGGGPFGWTFNLPVVKLLRENGVNPDIVSKAGVPALHFPERSSIESVRALLDLGLSPRTRMTSGKPVLNYLLLRGDKYKADIERMIRTAPDIIELPSKEGLTPLMVAALLPCRPSSLVEFLLGHGADINATNHKGKTLLDLVTSGNNDGTWVAFLRNLGALRSEEVKHAGQV